MWSVNVLASFDDAVSLQSITQFLSTRSWLLLQTQFSEALGTFMPISVFTVGAMDDIWTSVNYAEADPFSCGAASVAATDKSDEPETILLKPSGIITEDGTVIPLEGHGRRF